MGNVAALVSGEHDDRVREHLRRLERVHDGADAGVEGGHHRHDRAAVRVADVDLQRQVGGRRLERHVHHVPSKLKTLVV